MQAPDPTDPLAALVIGERPEPTPPTGWARIRVSAASLNHHDIFTLRGVGVAPGDLPMTLGCDAAGIDDDGNRVVAHAVINAPDWSGPSLLDPTMSVLSEKVQGSFADYVIVPRHNLLPVPDGVSLDEASCLPTAWLTAYHMLFCQAGLTAGESVLVQGASGGLAAATVVLAASAGIRVWLTSRDVAAAVHLMDLGATRSSSTALDCPDESMLSSTEWDRRRGRTR